jgi:hypothetical protein
MLVKYITQQVQMLPVLDSSVSRVKAPSISSHGSQATETPLLPSSHPNSKATNQPPKNDLQRKRKRPNLKHGQTRPGAGRVRAAEQRRTIPPRVLQGRHLASVEIWLPRDLGALERRLDFLAVLHLAPLQVEDGVAALVVAQQRGLWDMESTSPTSIFKSCM